ncbi:MAG: transposase, partial [Nitriliruptorales bacterium]|nr:transposase [Nitriliruptorales bacterium]
MHSSSWRFDTSTCIPTPKDLPSSLQQHGHCRSFCLLHQNLTQLPSGHTNALAESFFATLKNERVHRTVYPTWAHARKDIARYIEFRYNTRRIHS